MIGFLETIYLSSASDVTKLEHFSEIMNQFDTSRCGPQEHPTQKQKPDIVDAFLSVIMQTLVVLMRAEILQKHVVFQGFYGFYLHPLSHCRNWVCLLWFQTVRW